MTPFSQIKEPPQNPGRFSQQILADHQPVLEEVKYKGWLRWQPNRLWLVIVALVLFYSITEMEKVSEFLYFQF